MKKAITITAAILIWAATSICADAQQKKGGNSNDIQEVTFVTTIDCNNCKKKIEAKIPYEKGVKDMKVTLEEKTVWIKFDASKTTKDNLAEAIRKLGYEAEISEKDSE